MQLYYRLCKGLQDKGVLCALNEDYFRKINKNKDSYLSLFYYNQEQKKEFDKSGSIAGLTDVVTDQVFFDVDNEKDPGAAQVEAVKICEYLIENGIEESRLQICFSGKKGFSILFKSDVTFTPNQLKGFTQNIAKRLKLKTYDPKVYNASRVVRIPLTKHNDSGLYKLPLSLEELKSWPIEDIQATAEDKPKVPEKAVKRQWVATLPKKLKDLIPEKGAEIEVVAEEIDTTGLNYTAIDFSEKPSYLPPYKYALQLGYFPAGIRNECFMALAATYRAQGMAKEVAYHALKGTAERQAKLTGGDKYPKAELWTNIIEQVFSPNWKGGQYSAQNNATLKGIAEQLPEPYRSQSLGFGDDMQMEYLADLTSTFKEYVKHIDDNTIKTGIKTIDDNVFMTTGMHVGILGAPSSAKTTLALDILNNVSKRGIKSVFVSLDMHKRRIYEKVMYKLFHYNREELFDKFENDEEEPMIRTLEEEYGNMIMYPKGSGTVKEIREFVVKCREKTGERIPLIIIDYFERIFSDIADETANAKRVASELQDMANDLNLCVITLFQPRKMSGDAGNRINSMNEIKGSSFLAQSVRILLGISRPGFHPDHYDNDKWMNINILKNDFGELKSLYCNWDGKRQRITEMTETDKHNLDQFLQQLEQEKEEKRGSGFGRN